MSTQNNSNNGGQISQLTKVLGGSADVVIIALALIAAYLICVTLHVGDQSLLAGALISIIGYFFGSKGITTGVSAGAQASNSGNSNSGNNSAS